MAVSALLKLAGFTNELRYVDIAHQSLAQMQTPTRGGMMSQYPLGFGRWHQAPAYAPLKPRESSILGDPDSAATQALLSVIRDGYRPFQVVAQGSPPGQRPGRDDVQLARLSQLSRNAADPVGRIAAVPLLQDRGLVAAQATAYVCRGFTCQPPVTDPLALEQLLGIE